ncbi:MAG: DUF4493 domain-containing protein [Muribaculum sp.]|nr:DUF4493 domain-containing protein [Muribaculum sp.]
MKKFLNILLAAAAVASLGACSKENPFDGGEDVVYGKVSTASLRVELQNESGIPDVYNRPTRAGAPSVDNFTVEFFKAGEAEPEASYKYSEMPEIVTLPVGNYTTRASFGEDLPAAWENPYYKGETTFDVAADEITEDVDPIVCSLSNVRVSIAFDSALLAEMGDDCKVTVKVGDNGSLDFTKNDTEKSGYFAFVENSTTLAAHFQGTVEGYPASETKAYDNVAPGMHYRITFRLHQAGEEDPGEISGGLNVDASVEIVDMNGDIIPDDDIIEDDMRPTEDPINPEPGPGGDDPIVVSGPAITAKAPIVLDQVNNIDTSASVVLYIHSETGIQNFEVDIISDDLTPEELSGMGLQSHLDLVNPDGYADSLTGLGFPVRVGGMKDVDFDLTTFMPMLGVFGDHQHTFRLSVTDANGTTTKDLILKF